MEYIQKYKKYREKYKKLLIKLKGGYYLGDKSHAAFFLPRIERNLSFFPNYSDGAPLFIKPKGDLTFDKKNLISILNSPEYLELYQHLIYEFLDNTPYTQKLHTQQGVFQKFHVFKYHINFGSIIFLSFILELELFSLIHIKNGYNIVKPNMKSIKNELCPAIFPDPPNIYRFYKSIISENNIFNLANIFTSELDILFSFFMRQLVKNLSSQIKKKPEKEAVILVLNEIIPDLPEFTYDDYKDNTNITLYQFIFVNWKNRLSASLGISMEIINQKVETTIKEIQDKDAQYIAEGTGFFSFIFLGNLKERKRHYGSCITYSILEFYIMSRLHINGNNMKLILENQIGIDYTHDFWKYTQNELKFGITHWSTRFTLSTGIINFRSVFETKNEVPFIKPDSTPNEMFLKALIFPILDSNNQYIKTCGGDRLVEKFINDRSKIINRLLNREALPVITDTPSYEEIRLELKKYHPNPEYLEYLKDIPIDKINYDLNTYGQNLLYFSARNGNLNVVRALVNLPGINLNTITKNKSTPLDGADYGFDHNYFKNKPYRLEIGDLLLKRGAYRNKFNYR